MEFGSYWNAPGSATAALSGKSRATCSASQKASAACDSASDAFSISFQCLSISSARRRNAAFAASAVSPVMPYSPSLGAVSRSPVPTNFRSSPP